MASLVGLVALGVSVLILVWAWRRTRREPRRLSNGVWLGIGLLLVLSTLSGLGVSGVDAVFGVSAMLLFLSPLLVLTLIGFLLVNGLMMIRKEGRSLGNLLSLLTGIALIGVCALPVLTLQLPIFPAALALLLATCYLGFVFVVLVCYSAFYRRLVRSWPADWVVVLGSGLGGGSRVTPLLASRIDTGLRSATELGAGTVVMSGGKGTDEQLAEGTAMARWAIERGAPAALITVEDASRTTEENLRNTVELLAAREVGGPGRIVTSNYHAFRAAVLARHLGIDAQAVGAPTAGYFWPSAMLREYVALLREHRWWHLLAVALVAVPIPALLAGASLS